MIKDKKIKTWRLIYPNGEESITNYDPLKENVKQILKEVYGDYSNLINNLEDDLQLDLKNGENGYGSYKESWRAVKLYTLSILKKKIKKIEKELK